MASMMSLSSRAAWSSTSAGGEHRRQHLRVDYDGLPRPIRPVLPGSVGPRPGTPRPSSSSSPSWRAGRSESNWWGGGAARQQQHQQQATASAAPPRRPRSSSRGASCARVPTGKGNRELVRRALAPPAARGRGRSGGGAVLIRKWSFRPAPSRLRNASAASLPSQSPTSPRPRPS